MAVTKEELIAFEKEVADIYCEGKIRAPIHLSDSNEEQLMDIFQRVDKDDWVFSTWRSHYHALLHGIPRERLKEKVLAGDSITIMDAEYRFLASAIVGGIIPIAVGTAMGEKRQKTGRNVWCFVGDMSAETGGFHECVKYAENFDLPITFIIEDNAVSVGTPTDVVWGYKNDKVTCMPYQVSSKVWKYKYTKLSPHVGAGRWVTFLINFFINASLFGYMSLS